MKVKMQTGIPARKVAAATAAAAVAQVIAWALVEFTSVEALPKGLEEAFVVIATFVVGYYAPAHPRDVIEEVAPAATLKPGEYS